MDARACKRTIGSLLVMAALTSCGPPLKMVPDATDYDYAFVPLAGTATTLSDPRRMLPEAERGSGRFELKGLAIGPAGEVYALDALSRVILRAPDGTASVVARMDNIVMVNDDGLRASTVDPPRGIATRADGTLFVAHSHTLRRVDANGGSTIIAGGGTAKAGEPGLAARFDGLDQVGVAADGAVYLTEMMMDRRRIRRIGPDGLVSTLYDGEDSFLDLAVGPDGGLYVIAVAADSYRSGFSRGIRRVEGGQLVDTPYARQLKFPRLLAFGRDGTMFVVDGDNSYPRVSRIAPDGTRMTVVEYQGQPPPTTPRIAFEVQSLPPNWPGQEPLEALAVSPSGSELYLKFAQGSGIVKLNGF